MEKYKILFETSRDAIMLLEPPEWLFSAGNTAAIEMFGAKSKKEFTSKNPGELSPEYQADGQLSSVKAAKMINKAIKTGSNFFEWTHRRFNGKDFPANVLLSRIELDGKKIILATVRDITELKKKDKEIKKYQEHLQELVEERTLELCKSEKKYETLTKNINVGIYRNTEGSKGKFIEVNPAFLKMFGYINKKEILNKNVSDLYQNPEDRIKFTQQTIKKGYVKAEELLLKKKDGSNFIGSVSTVTIKDENGEIKYYDGVIQDITKRKNAEEKLKESEKYLRELNATKDKIFSIIAHDLISPFNTILGLSDLVVNDFDSFNLEKIKDIVITIQKDAKETFELLTNLLHWSLSQKGKIKATPKKDNIFDLIKNTIDLISIIAEKKEIMINIDVDKSDTAFFDKDTISLVFRNLFFNAIKFTHRGGRISVTSKRNKSDISISISDNGIGITKENIEKLFKVDSEISTKGTENEKGTGLGLILCKELTELNNGKIIVKSELGKGASFVVTLPLNERTK